jgi:NADH-quinone oxidoreductase subunit E
MNQIQETLGAEPKGFPQILVMEDEISVAKGLQMTLTEEGYFVDLAMTGKSALDTFNKKNFDLLLADLRLPDIDGMEVIRKVKNVRPDTEVIVITGYSNVPTAVEAMKLGAHDYLSKPFTEDELKSAVQDALKEKTATINKMEPDAFETLEKKTRPIYAAEEQTPEEIARIETTLSEIKREFKGTPDELIAMLQRVQSTLGYLPEDVLMEIARVTKLPSASVYGVASFYEQFRLFPVGKHVIRVCRGTACHVRGSDRILNHMESMFQLSPGKTSKDRLFTLETVACFGACAIAPVVVINDSVKGRMNPSKTGKTLIEIRKGDMESSPDMLQENMGG